MQQNKNRKKYTKRNLSTNTAQRFLCSNIVPDFRQNEYAKESPSKTLMQKNWPPIMFQINAAQYRFVIENHS